MTNLMYQAILRTIRNAAHLWLHNRDGDSLTLTLAHDDLNSAEMLGKKIVVEFRLIDDKE